MNRTSRQRPAIADKDFYLWRDKTMFPANIGLDCCLFDTTALFGEQPKGGLHPSPGKYVIRTHKDISPSELRMADIGKMFLWQHDWHDNYPWACQQMTSGVFELRLLAPDGNLRSFEDRMSLLDQGEVPAPLVLLELLLLCLQCTGLPDPLRGEWVFCPETNSSGQNIALSWSSGRIIILNGMVAGTEQFAWFAACKRLQ